MNPQVIRCVDYAPGRSFPGCLLLVLVGVFAMVAPVTAQHAYSPYAGQNKREIKAFSPEQASGLRSGAGMGMAKSTTLPLFFSGSVSLGILPEPFVSSCMDDQRPAIGIEGAAGVRLGSEWDVRLQANIMREALGEACALNVPLRSEGVHRLRIWRDEMRGDGLQTVGIHAGYAPDWLPFVRVSGGAGFEWERAVPYIALGANLQLGSGRFRVLVGSRFLMLRTPYRVVEEHWVDGRVVLTNWVGNGHEWTRGTLLRLGAEIAVNDFS